MRDLDTSSIRQVRTDARGEASIRYFAGRVSGRRTIEATVDIYGGQRDTATFTISVGGARDTRDDDDDDDDDVDDGVDDTANTITVIPGSFEGAPWHYGNACCRC